MRGAWQPPSRQRFRRPLDGRHMLLNRNPNLLPVRRFGQQASVGYHAPERSAQGLLRAFLVAFLGASFGAFLGASFGAFLGASFGVFLDASVRVSIRASLAVTLDVSLAVTLILSWRLRHLRKRHGIVGERAQVGEDIGALATPL